MIRSIFATYPVISCIVLFAAAMLAIRFEIAPLIVRNFGLLGTLTTLAAIFGCAVLLDKRRV